MVNKNKKNQKRNLGFEEEFEFEDDKKSNKKKSAKKTSKSGIIKIPKTVQDTIPYVAVYKNGIIETDPGIFSKSYRLEDVNFKIATDEEQEDIYIKYIDLLNTFDSDIKMQLVIYNRNMDEKNVYDKILIPYNRDNLNDYREEYNEMLKDKMKEGRNNIVKEKYITLSLKADSLEDAFVRFSKIDTEINTQIKRITGIDTQALTTLERLEILADIFSDSSDSSAFYQKANISGKNLETFNYSWMLKEGLTTKDLIGPSSFKFSKDYFEIGNKFAKTLFIDEYPTFMNSNVLSDMTEINSNMLISINYNKVRQDKALALIRNLTVNINSNVIDAQKAAAKAGYSPDLISPELLRAQSEAQELMDDITKRNQALILTTIAITIMGDTKDELLKNQESLMTALGKHMIKLKSLDYQQEKGFSTSLPLGRCDIFTDRMLTSQSAAIFVPFEANELIQSKGMYYGLNAVSKNLILFNRKNSKNANGVILGQPGSGKSFMAKREIISVILNTDDDVYIIDPEGEYLPLAKLLDGEVIKIAAGGGSYLNPMDMDINYGDDDENKNIDPIAMKCDFIGGLCETMMGDKKELTSIQKSIVDRCVRILYQPYLEHMSKVQLTNPEISCDTKASPTLKDLYDILRSQPEYDAAMLALSLERFCVGTYDTFSHHTNVRRKKRFIVYDIKDIGDGMKEMGLQVCLNAIWNQIIENRKINRYTWFYIDEFYLLTQTASSASFLQQVFKRCRKWYGISSGITQNCSDLLESPQAVTILNNCEFIIMLNQSAIDRMHLAKMLNISPTQLSYITNSDPGQGLIYTGKTIVPFIDKFPKNTKLYKVMTTRPNEV